MEHRVDDTSAGISPASPAALADGALVARILAGEGDALSELIDRLHAPMLRLARAILGGTAQVPDVVQDAWIAVITALPAFEARATLKTWVLRIVANKAKTAAAQQGRREVLGLQDEQQEDDERAVDGARFTWIGTWRNPPRAWGESDPERDLLRKEIGEILARELEALPPGQRAVVTLRDVDGVDAEEACAVLGLSEANQRVLLHRGRSRLRAQVERALEGAER